MSKLIKILSIDGGGIRGILPGMILAALEEKLQKKSGNPDARLADHFDFMAGTSTGGILACTYLLPSKENKGRPAYSARQAVELYLQNGGGIFDLKLKQKLASGFGLSDEKYHAGGLESILTRYYEDIQLKNLLRPCLITAYDIQRRNAHFFRQHRAGESDAENFLVRDVARATSAAPTYFEAARVKSLSGIAYPLVDGGVFANNPALCAYAEARKIFKKQDEEKGVTAGDMFILSVGTGQVNKPYPHEKAKDWGALGWIQPVIDIMMTGVSETVAYQLMQIYQAIDRPEQYVRLAPGLDGAKPEMDDASEKNLLALKEAGAYNAHRFDAELERVAGVLAGAVG